MRDLRYRTGDVLRRVAAGEHLTVTRYGIPVAELRPVERTPLSSAVLLERWRHLPRVDPAKLRAELDGVIDPSL